MDFSWNHPKPAKRVPLYLGPPPNRHDIKGNVGYHESMRCDFKVKSMEDRPTGLSHPWGVPWGAARNFSHNVWNFGANNSRSIPWIYLVSNPVFFFPPCLALMEKLPTWMQTETERNHSGCGGFMFLWLLGMEHHGFPVKTSTGLWWKMAVFYPFEHQILGKSYDWPLELLPSGYD